MSQEEKLLKKEEKAKRLEDATSTVKRPMEEGEPKLKLHFDRLVRMGFHVWRQIDDPYYAGFAAQIAYFFFMSIIPTLVVLTQVLGLFDVSLDFILSWLNRNLGKHMTSVIEGLFSAGNVGLTNLFMVVLALWSASSLIFSLSRLFSYTLSNGRYRFNFFSERVRAIPIALFTSVIIAAALLLFVYGDLIFNDILGESEYVQLFLKIMRGPGFILLFYILVYSLYMMLPRFRLPVRSMLPGTLFAALSIWLVTMLYSLYIDYAVNYDILYGSFANIVAMLLWFYLISWVLELGMMFNKSWDIYMARGRLSPAKIREYLLKHLEGNDAKMALYYYPEGTHFDRTIDTVAVDMSRKFVPGFSEIRDAYPDKYDGAPDRERNSG